MRIIAGSARGRRLFSPPGTNRAIRPTADRAREALFNIIGSRIVDSNAVDLFAGTGAWGCEALSRGAARVVFIDNSGAALDIVARNVNLVPDGPARATLLKFDLSRGLPRAGQARGFPPYFDIVFADPPYLSGLSEKTVFFLDKSGVLSQNPLIIVEEQKGFRPPETLETIILSDRRTYGESSFFFFSINPCLKGSMTT